MINVFICGHNVEKYIARCISSVLMQEVNFDIHITYVDDASNDSSLSIAENLLYNQSKVGHTLIANNQRLGKAFSAFTYLPSSNQEITAILDGDDELNTAKALSRLHYEYLLDYDVVWSNYITTSGRIGHCNELNIFESARNQRWLTSHLFSFRTELFANIPQSFFQGSNGNWVTSACDVAIALPILDQTRRTSYINEPLYLYRDNNPASHHNKGEYPETLSSEDQTKNARLLYEKTPFLPNKIHTPNAFQIHKFFTNKIKDSSNRYPAKHEEDPPNYLINDVVKWRLVHRNIAIIDPDGRLNSSQIDDLKSFNRSTIISKYFLFQFGSGECNLSPNDLPIITYNISNNRASYYDIQSLNLNTIDALVILPYSAHRNPNLSSAVLLSFSKWLNDEQFVLYIHQNILSEDGYISSFLRSYAPELIASTCASSHFISYKSA